MTESVVTARIIDDGDSQIVRLPEQFRLPGHHVEVSRLGRGLLIEPTTPKKSPEEIKAILAELKRLAAEHGDFMPEGREQPPMPPDDDIDPID